MIPNGEKERKWHYLAVKKLSALLGGINSKDKSYFYYWNVFILLEQKINLNLMKNDVKIKTYVEL